MDMLATAGCRNIFIGLDSGNDHIRNDILQKGTSVEQTIDVCKYLNQKGIKAVVSNMIGLPYETPEAFQDTIDVNKVIHKHQVVFSSAYGAAPKLWVFTPWQGSPLYDLCKENGWLRNTPKKNEVYRSVCTQMPYFPEKEFDRLYARFRYEVYRDSHPFFACLFRLYDTKFVRFLMNRLPAFGFAQLRHISSVVSDILKPKLSDATTPNEAKK